MYSAPPNTSVLEFLSDEAVKPYGKPIEQRRKASSNLGRASIAFRAHHMQYASLACVFSRNLNKNLKAAAVRFRFWNETARTPSIRFTFPAFRLGSRQYLTIF